MIFPSVQKMTMNLQSDYHFYLTKRSSYWYCSVLIFW